MKLQYFCENSSLCLEINSLKELLHSFFFHISIIMWMEVIFTFTHLLRVSFAFICVGSCIAKGKEESHSWETNIGRETGGLVAFELAFTFLFQTKKQQKTPNNSLSFFFFKLAFI